MDDYTRTADLRARLACTLARLIRRVERALGRPACRVCGCTEYAACPGGCFWADDDQTLCSSCEWDLDLEQHIPSLVEARP